MHAEGSSSGPSTAVPGARHALLLLVLINLFNFIDRQVLAAVEPEVRAEFFTDPGASAAAFGMTVPTPAYPLAGVINSGAAVAVPELTERRAKTGFMSLLSPKGWMGMLSFAFLFTYMLAAPIFGWLATRTSRWLLIGLGVMVWSLASGGSGLAHLYLVMLLTRCLVGIGEGAYGPVAPDIISDLFPVSIRGRVLAWFYAAIPVGGALGYTLGSVMVKATGDWRWAFYVVVPPGILLGLWCFLMREPKRGGADRIDVGKRKGTLRDYLILLRTPSYVLNCLGMTFTFFAMGGMAFWVPAYLKYRGVYELFGMPAPAAFGAIIAASGLAATLIGGMTGDALRGRVPGSYFVVSGVAMLIGFPLLLLVVYLPFPMAWWALVGFSFCLFFNTGPTNTVLANVVHPLLRAPGFALNILITHLFGDAISPTIIGELADAYGFDRAFQFISVTVLLAGVFWLWGAAYLERDMELAPERAPSS